MLLTLCIAALLAYLVYDFTRRANAVIDDVARHREDMRVVLGGEVTPGGRLDADAHAGWVIAGAAAAGAIPVTVGAAIYTATGWYLIGSATILAAGLVAVGYASLGARRADIPDEWSTMDDHAPAPCDTDDDKTPTPRETVLTIAARGRNLREEKIARRAARKAAKG